MFRSSVVSYPNRGDFGNASYRGNTTGHIIVDLIETFLPPGGLFVDVTVGGGTSKDVASAMGVRFCGLDLHSGFNLLRNDLLQTLGEPANLTLFHPPYGQMVKYSSNMWGSKPHPDDLSHMSDNDFEKALELALFNISDATTAGGHYAVLMGNQRRKGQYLNWSSLTERLAPDPLKDELIKIQHNCTSDTRQYNTPLIRINHEKLLVFQKRERTNAITNLESKLNNIQLQFKADLLVTMKRMFQCRHWTLQEILDCLECLAPSSPMDLRQAIIEHLNSPTFTVANGYYALS